MTHSREHLRQTVDDEIKLLEGSIRVLRHRRNALAPISSLPPEIFGAIFSLLPAPGELFTLGKEPDHLAWLCVAHVCHQWREIALNQPFLWNHVNFTSVSSAGAAEILARTKTVPLHLEANVPFGDWDDARFSAFQKELQDHTSHIRHLDHRAESIQVDRTLNRLTSPAPSLEYLSLYCQENQEGRIDSRVSIPDTLFNGSTPRLSSLKLYKCAISWKSPLLRGIKHLDICTSFETPSLTNWLDALDEMPQLKTLILVWASPIAPYSSPLPSHVERTVTLSSLTLFEITSHARDCGLALAHLVLPALTRLWLRAGSGSWTGSDVPDILPHVVRHTHALQHTQPLRSVFARSNSTCVEILAWTLPSIDEELFNRMGTDLPNQITFLGAIHPVQMVLSVIHLNWSPETHKRVFDEIMAVLPLNSLVTLTTQRHTDLDKQFWLRHAPHWPLLQHVRLAHHAARGLREMLLQGDNGGCQGPLLPSLKKLVLVDAVLSTHRARRLCDALMKRTLDLRTCLVTGRAVELLSEIVSEVLGEETYGKETSMVPNYAVDRGLFIEDDNSGVEE
ncbi:hypothetical protein EI94DRAFT_1752350 [Lactarius quietus]|nr:hypothetical protein EI94DRAFT_1752350 [Lactarius quietus]